MSSPKPKPLRWSAPRSIGYTVVRRPDGGMSFIFKDMSPETLKHWREFSLEHLLDSDRLTRNLYDLRQIDELPERAIRYAAELNNDPGSRHIRLAVVATGRKVREALRRVVSLTVTGGVDMRVFSDIAAAEAWLARPIELV